MAVITENVEIEVTVKDDLDQVVDLANATGILVALYFNGNHVLEKWSLNAKAGYKNVIITDAPNGIFSVFLERTESAQAQPATARLEVHVSFLNPNFSGSSQVNIATNIELEKFVPSVLKNVTP